MTGTNVRIRSTIIEPGKKIRKRTSQGQGIGQGFIQGPGQGPGTGKGLGQGLEQGLGQGLGRGKNKNQVKDQSKDLDNKQDKHYDKDKSQDKDGAAQVHARGVEHWRILYCTAYDKMCHSNDSQRGPGQTISPAPHVYRVFP